MDKPVSITPVRTTANEAPAPPPVRVTGGRSRIAPAGNAGPSTSGTTAKNETVAIQMGESGPSARFTKHGNQRGAPAELAEAEEEFIRATARCQRQPTLQHVTELERAIAKYKETANKIHQVALGANAPVDPSLRRAAANIATGMARNIVGFAVPVYAAVLAAQAARADGADEAQARQVQSATFATGIFLGNSAMEMGGDYLRAWLGGTTSSTLLAGKNTATEGAYRKIAGTVGESIVGTMAYTVGRALLLSVLPTGSPGLGSAARSAAGTVAGGLTLNVAREAVLAGAARATLRRNHVKTAADLPVTPHNRTLKSGAYLRQPDFPHRQGTTTDLAKKYGGAALGYALGAAAQWVIDYYADIEKIGADAPTTRPNNATIAAGPGGSSAAVSAEGTSVAGEFLDATARFSTFFIVKGLVDALWTRLVTHPDRHANEAAISESTLAASNLRQSALNGYEALLDQTSRQFKSRKGGGPGSAKGLAELSRSVLSGTERDKRKAMEDIGVFAAKLREQEGKLRRLPRRDVGLPSVFERMADRLDGSARALERLSQSIAKEQPTHIWLKDAQNRLRDVQALMAESLLHTGQDVKAEHIRPIIGKIMPVLVGLRELDRTNNAKAFEQTLAQYRNGKCSARSLADSLNLSGHRAFFADDAAEALKDARWKNEDLKETVDRARQALSGGKPDVSKARTKLEMVLAAFNRDPNVVSSDAAAIVAGIEATRTDPALKELAEQYKIDLMSGLQDAGALRAALQQVRDTAGEGRWATVERAFGTEFISALEREWPAPESDPGYLFSQSRLLLDKLEEDLTKMAPQHKSLYAAASRLPDEFANPVSLPAVKQNDVHFHPTSYSGVVNDLELLEKHMDANGIERTNLAGIPSQVYKQTDERKYYANSENKIYYRDHDFPLANQLDKIRQSDPQKFGELKKRFDLSITGFDVTDGPTIGRALDERLAAYPGLFKSVGEVTLKKEIISDKNPTNPEIGSEDTQKLLRESFRRGLPMILHCDRGHPGDKNAYEKGLINALEKVVGDLKLRPTAGDPPAMAGKAPPKAKVIWAHGGGISRFTVGGKTHTERLDKLLDRPTLKDALMIDLSWDYIAHDILRNTYDLFTKKGFPESITDGIQSMLKTYQAFAAEGSRADKASDLGDANLAAMHRVAAEKIAALHLKTVEDFRETVAHEVAHNPQVKAKLRSVIDSHGKDGNNWLHVLNKHQDRFLFGTDALSVGSKAHGDSAYALNTRILDPIYAIFDAIAKAEGREDEITPKIARRNYEKFMDDPQILARRRDWEQHLKENPPKAWSASTKPQVLDTRPRPRQESPKPGPSSADTRNRSVPAELDDTDSSFSDGPELYI